MSYSARTQNLELPQWVKGTKDHPDFLTDMNQAFEKIDTFAGRIDGAVGGLPEQMEELSTQVTSLTEEVHENTSGLASLGVRTAILENKVQTQETLLGNLDDSVSELEPKVEAVETKMSSMEKLMHLIETVTPTAQFTDFNYVGGRELTIDAYRRGNLLHVNLSDKTNINSFWVQMNVLNIWRFNCGNKEAFKTKMGIIQGEDFSVMTYGIVVATNGETCAIFSLHHDSDDSIYIKLMKLSTAIPSDNILGGVCMIYREEGGVTCETEN